MKKDCLFLKIMREFIVFALLMVTVIGIFSVPADGCMDWFGTFLVSKAIGFATGFIMYKLVMYWSANKMLVDNVDDMDDIA